MGRILQWNLHCFCCHAATCPHSNLSSCYWMLGIQFSNYLLDLMELHDCSMMAGHQQPVNCEALISKVRVYWKKQQHLTMIMLMMYFYFCLLLLKNLFNIVSWQTVDRLYTIEDDYALYHTVDFGLPMIRANINQSQSDSKSASEQIYIYQSGPFVRAAGIIIWFNWSILISQMEIEIIETVSDDHWPDQKLTIVYGLYYHYSRCSIRAIATRVINSGIRSIMIQTRGSSLESSFKLKHKVFW